MTFADLADLSDVEEHEQFVAYLPEMARDVIRASTETREKYEAEAASAGLTVAELLDKGEGRPN